MEQEQIKSYLDDISYIKGIIRDNEETVIIEHWAWYAWAVMTTAGTLIHYFLFKAYKLEAVDAFLYIWLPVFIVGVIIETIALLIRSGKDDFPFMSKKFIRFILAVITTSIIIITMIIHMLRTGILVPGIILTAVAVPFSIYGIWSLSYLFIEAFILLAAGLLFYLGHGTSPAAYLAAGIFCSAVFAAGGIHSYFFDRHLQKKRDARLQYPEQHGERSE